MADTFYKLGKDASVFNDPSTGLIIRNKEVVKVENKHIRSKKTQIALRNGHINPASELEYKVWLGEVKPEVEAADTTEASDEKVDMLMGKTKTELVEWMEAEGFVEADILEAAAIKDKAKRVAFVIAAEKTYNG